MSDYSKVKLAGPLLLALVFVGCGKSDLQGATSTIPEQSEMTIADFRLANSQTVSVTSPERAKQVIDMVFGSPAPNDVWLADQSAGAFTAVDTTQHLYLLSRGAQLNNPEYSKRSLLAVFEGDQVVAQFVPPANSYHNIRGTVDINNDGMQDVLLTSNAYQMGETVITADFLSLANGQRIHLHTLGQVFRDDCDAPHATGQVVAAKVAQSETGELIRYDYAARCPVRGEDLEVSDFKPLG